MLEEHYNRRRFLGAIMTLAASELAMIGSAKSDTREPSNVPLIESELSSLNNATGWINSQPLTPSSLRGKIVLINFCTYTCINWLRALPYVRAWAEKYKAHGLVVIGVHTPEFTFEKNLDNVRRAIHAMKIDYPIAIDNDYTIWKAFQNNYWPASFFLDTKGSIQHYQFGEGEYETSEKVIQHLLSKSGIKGINQGLVSVNPTGVEAAPDWTNLKSPENYLGYDRTENFSSAGRTVSGKSRHYTFPERLILNQWALSGNWTLNKEAVVLNQTGGKIACCFHGRDLHLVMGPSSQGTTTRFRIFIDGLPPGAAHGVDVDDQGNGKVTEQRLYQLIRQPNQIADRRFEIEFQDSGVEAFAFTFG